MRRFESKAAVELRTTSGRRLAVWVAGSRRARLAGLALLPGLPAGQALLIPRCRSVHTVGMRFEIDIAFVAWPPTAGRCEVVALRPAVPPLRIVASRDLPSGVGALEAPAPRLATCGLAPATYLSVA